MDTIDFSFLKFIAMAVGIWLGVNFLLAFLSGWFSLAREYRASESFEGKKWYLQSGDLGWFWPFGSMRGVLNIGANRAGLYLSVLFPFRPGKPPLFIPWTDISVKTKKGIFFKYTVFKFRRVPSVPLKIMERVGREIIAFGKNYSTDDT